MSETKATLTTLFNAAKDADNCISADDLTEIVQVLTERESLSAKTVRQALRDMSVRDQSKYKNARYRIDKALTETVVKRFTRKAS
jgi:hypothetical protein